MSNWTSAMRRGGRAALVVAIAAAGVVAGGAPPASSAVSGASIVISEVYGAGGASGAAYNTDYVELFNRGDAAQNVQGWNISVASATGTTWTTAQIPAKTIPAGGYLLLQLFQPPTAEGAALPATDVTTTAGLDLQPFGGKVALYIPGSFATNGTACPTATNRVDFIGYGGGTDFVANCAETSVAPGGSATLAPTRKLRGCQDTQNNGTDVQALPPMPRNAASGAALCLPDLRVDGEIATPETVHPGDQFTVQDITINEGSEDSLASVTHLVLSLDTSLDGADIQVYSRNVGPLVAPTGRDVGPAEDATVPVDTPFGTYHLLSCADGPGSIAEEDETDNCVVNGGLVSVEPPLPNLEVTAVASPPATRMQGQKLAVADTTNNDSDIDAGASKTRYYLSKNGVWDDTDIVHVVRDVPALAAGTPSVGSPVSAAIPLSTPVGSYRVLACADDNDVVDESNETDNCRASTGSISVTKALPDLIVKAVSTPPASRKQGETFAITDTTKNKGLVKVGASETWFYLSTDKSLSNGDKRLRGAHVLKSLEGGGIKQDTTTVTVPSTTKPDTYSVLACADGSELRTESSETNNCKASRSTIKILKA